MKNRVYIANSTQQHWLYHYRLPEFVNTRVLMVYSGCQAYIDTDSPGMLTALLADLHRLGVKEDKTIKLSSDDFCGIFYKVEKIITKESIQENFEVVKKNAVDVSIKEAKKAGMGVELAVTKARRGKRAIEVGVGIKGDTKANGRDTGNDTEFNLTVAEGATDDPKINGLR